jgi:ubiquinone biosynthesis protein
VSVAVPSARPGTPLAPLARGLTLSLRAARIGLAFAWIPVAYLAWLLVQRDPPGLAARQAQVGVLLAEALESLGATFVKLGQILGSRPDLLPAGLISPLARLQDRVAPVPYEDIERVLAAEWTGAQRAEVTLEPVPIAAASVAQVHAATYRDGRRLAIKVQRPRAREQVARDLAVMRGVGRLLDVLPDLRLLSIPGALERFGAALEGQIDFRVEAANNRRFAANFARIKKLRVPTLLPELCTERVLAMEFVEGVKATEPEKVRGDRRDIAERGGRAILKMVFEDGFVHADLHPGNILLSADGTMTFLDTGLVAEMPPDLVRPWVDTFSSLAKRDGAWSARLFYGFAPSVAVEDYDAYERDVSSYLAQYWEMRLGEVEVSRVVTGMMEVLRRHRVQVEPVFTVVNVALLVAEGLGKQLDPEIDLVMLAVPYLLSAQLTAPPGRPPLRSPPPRADGMPRGEPNG